MNSKWMAAVLVSLSMAATGCEDPNEKPAQEMLKQAMDAQGRGDSTGALITCIKLDRQYPTTKAAVVARGIREQLSAQTERENTAREAKAKRIAEKIAASKDALRALSVSTDDMKQVSWYGDKAAKNWVLGKYLKLYFGIGENGSQASLYPLRLKLQFEGEEWLFVRTVSIKAGDKVYDLTPEDWKRENSSGTVWESCDLPLSAESPELLAALGGADYVKVRFEGRDLYSDFVVPKLQIHAAKRVYAVWKSINDAGEAKP